MATALPEPAGSGPGSPIVSRIIFRIGVRPTQSSPRKRGPIAAELRAKTLAVMDSRFRGKDRHGRTCSDLFRPSTTIFAARAPFGAMRGKMIET